MASPRNYAWFWRRVYVASLLVSVGQSAIAADNTAEREQLAALTRQLDLVDRLVEQAAKLSPSDQARYHFDYGRLRDDIQHVRTGVQDYLVPQRAQPRDPLPLMGDYTRSNADAQGGKAVSEP